MTSRHPVSAIHATTRFNKRRACGLIFMFTVAPVIGFVTLAIPHSMAFRLNLIAAVMTSGLVVAVATVLAWRWVSNGFEHLALVYAIGAITAVNLLARSPSTPYSAFYFWTVIYAAWFFGSRQAVVYVLLTIAGLATSLATAPAGSDAGIQWIAQSAAMALTAVAIQAARLRLESTLGELHAAATTDGLTGVANRRAFDTAVRDCVAATSGAPAALVMIDLDKFKAINDADGHPAGDRTLRRVARALLRRARVDDVVARIGGDEFAVILFGTTAADAFAFAEDIRASLRSNTTGDPAILLSIGVAEMPPAGQASEPWLALADRAVYASKRAGGDRTTVAEGSSQSPARAERLADRRRS